MWWLGAFAVLFIVGGLAMLGEKAARARRYREKVGLDLAGLTALVPEHQRKPFTRFLLAPAEPEQISVGLVFDDGRRSIGNPPNVGLRFDRRTGALLSVHPEGIGLGLK